MPHLQILPTPENIETLKMFFKAFRELSLLFGFIWFFGHGLGIAYYKDCGNSFFRNMILVIWHAVAALLVWISVIVIPLTIEGSWVNSYLSLRPSLFFGTIITGYCLGLVAYLLTRPEDRRARNFST